MKPALNSYKPLALVFLLVFLLSFALRVGEPQRDQAALKGSQAIERAPSAVEAQALRTQAPEMIEFKENLKKKDWIILRDQLENPTFRETMLTNLAQQKWETKDHAAIFEMLVSLLKEPELEPKAKVLGISVLSEMNLEKSQQRVMRDLFQMESMQRFREDLMFKSFRSTIPFPKDLAESLISDFHRSPSRSQDIIHLTALIRDKNQKKKFEQAWLQGFSKTNDSMKPLLVKSLFLTAEPEIKHTKAFLKMLEFAKNQDGEVWSEIKDLIR